MTVEFFLICSVKKIEFKNNKLGQNRGCTFPEYICPKLPAIKDKGQSINHIQFARNFSTKDNCFLGKQSNKVDKSSCDNNSVLNITLELLVKMSSTARRILLLSNSTLHPTGYLEYAEQHICDFLKENNVRKVIYKYV